MNCRFFSTLIIIFLINLSCQKFLDKVPDQSLTIPSTLKDFDALLNNNYITQRNMSLGDLSCDDWYCTYSGYQSLPLLVRNCFIWQKDIFEGSTSSDWNAAYYAIYYANIVLENIGKISDDTTSTAGHIAFDELKGRAFFIRAFSYYNLSQIFIVPYDSATATTDLGLPLRLHSDPNEKVARSSVRKTYEQMISDALQAKDLLGTTVNENTPNVPSKSAAYALLSKIYLSMGSYQDAGAYADSSLQLYSTLIDYNSLDTTKKLAFPIPTNNEVIYLALQGSYFSPFLRLVDSSLYRSYANGDLRKVIFFNTRNGGDDYYFRGSYTGTYTPFCGLATDEMYLNRAECYARAGDVTDAMADLNTLLKMRFQKGHFTNLIADNAEDAVRLILTERRKELIFRNVRWSDLRRLNQDSRFAITLTRQLNGQTYTLPPNDPKYTFPIPPDEISLGGVQQNKR